MKKYLFMAIAAIASFALVGCQQGNDNNDPDNPGTTPTPDAQVVISPKTLELTVEGEGKLRAALNPSKDGVTISFSSENAEIATVNNSGLVTGVATGTVNIIASAEGYKSDTCVVTVVSATDAFAWGGIFVTRDDNYKILNDKDTAIIKINDGSEEGLPVKCILVSGSGFAWDNNIFMDNASETGLSGIGHMAFLDEVPVWQIVDSIDDKGYNFYYVTPNIIYFVEDYNANDTAFAYCTPVGKMGDAATQLNYWTTDDTEAIPGVTGTEIWYMDASTFRGVPTVGLIGTGAIQGDTKEAFYRMNIGWFEDESLYGLKATLNAEEKLEVVEPAQWAAIEYKEYAKLHEQTAVQRYALQAPNSDMEKIYKKVKAMRTDRMYKK